MTSIEMQSFHLSRCYHDIYSDAIMTSIQILSWHLSRCYHVIYSDVIMSSIQMQSLSSIQMQSCHLSNHAIFLTMPSFQMQLCHLSSWYHTITVPSKHELIVFSLLIRVIYWMRIFRAIGFLKPLVLDQK
jgi:hypothetical protein